MNTAMQVFNAIVQENGTVSSVASAVTEGTSYVYAMQPIINYAPAMNAFIDTLVNKIIQIAVRDEMYETPFSVFKREGNPLGYDYEITYVNPAKARNYSLALGNTLLDTNKPDVKVQYFRRNREAQYWVTVPRELYMGGWTEWAQLDDFISKTVKSLSNGNARDEQELYKQCVIDSYNSGLITKLPITWNDGDEAGSENLVEAINSVITRFPFYSTNFNNWLPYAVDNGRTDELPAETFTKMDNIKILMSAESYTVGRIKSLASMFNLSLADFTSKVIVVDDFAYAHTDSFGVHSGSAPEVLAVVMDIDTATYRDTLNMSENFHNAANMSNNIYLNVWQTYMFNMCKNCVAIVDASKAPVITMSVSGSVISCSWKNMSTNTKFKFHRMINGAWGVESAPNQPTATEGSFTTNYPAGTSLFFIEGVANGTEATVYSNVITV